MKTFLCELQVRGYELDGYGHVNHAVYLNYAEHARWQMIETAGGSAEYFKQNGVSPVVVNIEVNYRNPSFLAEWLKVETTLEEYRKRVVKFRQRIIKRDANLLAAELVVTLVAVDLKTGKAASLPTNFQEIFGVPAKSES